MLGCASQLSLEAEWDISSLVGSSQNHALETIAIESRYFPTISKGSFLSVAFLINLTKFTGKHQDRVL